MRGPGRDAEGDAAPGADEPLAARLERSGWGRVVLSTLVVVVLLTEIGTHLPESAIERSVGATSNQIVRILGVEQAWGVFAPDPRRIRIDVEARVTFADGSTTTWTVPEGARIGENLRFYRWRKWLERIRADSFSGLWRPTAEWVASLYDDAPSPVVRVKLVRYFRENRVSGEQPPWQAFTYHTLELEPEESA